VNLAIRDSKFKTINPFSGIIPKGDDKLNRSEGARCNKPSQAASHFACRSATADYHFLKVKR
jgi:hypothetical protein